MMTPQEVASHSFAKATLGGYNLAQVDEFLDALTEDYTALYPENAILKNKLKVLSNEVEEHRANEANVSKALLDAHQQADLIIAAAKKTQDELVGEAQKGAQGRIAELEKAVAAEEYRLKKAQESTAAYVKKLARAHEDELQFLSSLGDLVPPEMAVADDPAADIKAALDAQVRREEEAEAQQTAAPQKPAPRVVAVGPDDDIPPLPDDFVPQMPEQEELELDPDATRRYSDLQFGKDYQIK